MRGGDAFKEIKFSLLQYFIFSLRIESCDDVRENSEISWALEMASTPIKWPIRSGRAKITRIIEGKGFRTRTSPLLSYPQFMSSSPT